MEECKVCGGKGFYFIERKRTVCKNCVGRGLVELAYIRPYDYQQLLKEEKQRVRL